MKTKVKVLSLFTALMILLSSQIILPVTATEPEPSTIAVASLGTDENGVYLIANAADLEAFRDSVASGNTYEGKTVKLGDDIVLTTPIRIGSATDAAKNFKGTFDGNGKTVTTTGMTFFEQLLSGSIVKNLKLVINVTGDIGTTSDDGKFGGLASIIDGATVQDCEITVTTPASGVTVAAIAHYHFGTVAGYLTNATVKNVKANCDIRFTTGAGSPDLAIGGIAGFCTGSSCSITNCTVDGKITIISNTDGNGARFGGILGIFQSCTTSTINGCVNNADITLNPKSGTNINKVFIGGILGISDGGGTTTLVDGCVNTGNVTVNQTVGSKGASSIVGATYSTAATVSNNANFGKVYVGGALYDIVHFNSGGSLKQSGNYQFADTKNTSDNANNNHYYNVAAKLHTEDQASIRIDYSESKTTGIRFTSYIDSALYGVLSAENNNVDIEFGTIIAPTAIINNYGIDEFLKVGTKVKYDIDKYASEDKGVNGFDEITGNNCYFTGALTGIGSDYYDLVFTAVAYLTIKVNGVSYTYYADYNGTGTDETTNARARSIAWVAQQAKNDVKTQADFDADATGTLKLLYGNDIGDGKFSCYSDKQLAVIDSYLGEQ